MSLGIEADGPGNASTVPTVNNMNAKLTSLDFHPGGSEHPLGYSIGSEDED